jgi:SAM-dependent methyltransferase
VPVVDLGSSPLCERYLAPADLERMEPFYPLRLYLCPSCGLAQLPAYVPPDEIFSEYAYFSSFSRSWLEHARTYAERMIEERGLTRDSLVVEVASNDGYLLRNFVERQIPVLGIDPAANVARAAVDLGVPTIVRFFGREVADELVTEGHRADLLVGNNVVAHVPDVNDFVAGLARLLAPEGLLTLEFPHVQRLLEGNQFDTIYHEHFSYFGLSTVTELGRRHALDVVDVEELPTHGGSLRVHFQHESAHVGPNARVATLAASERAAGLHDRATYVAFSDRVEATKRDVLEFLIDARRRGMTIAGYGAPGKAVTFLNYSGIGPDLLSYTVDRNPYKHGMFMAGTRNPIFPVEHLAETRPDVIWILPWNIRDEIVEQLSYARAWGARFMVAIPGLEIIG